MELCKLCDTFVPTDDTDTVQVRTGTEVTVCSDCSYMLYQIVSDVVDPQ
jgi:ribosome-binding protein aMBF1 (putative translation factor)